ncbi:transaldolase [Endozoicomonas montiporae]|uniref:Transaldolase n=2 Tax=Endozoicomonas montiporae TaxID=1027273 RepID=A0A081N0H8_9GAMM|nr:transaldolase [Endozoicomonas montiporae]AMO54412.1 transaldolase B [Endozoicomonas montiporae CL-33]KEQ11951.1 transaldolase [Endozoicomonas montiporae]
MKSQLDQLRKLTKVVADTGDIEAIRQYQPVDATTNPSLILKAAALPDYQPLLKESIEWAQAQGEEDIAALACDWLTVNIGKAILDVVPGLVSTEVDARLSFDTEATVKKAQKIIELYRSIGVDTDRVLIKIASTWEGIRAAETLEQQGIRCNLTLLFSFAQAKACADAGVYLISPFVGRIMDWYKASQGVERFAPEEDPGVLSVSKIYNYYKQNGFKTVVMGASFRNIDEIRQLAGCDCLTIAPPLLDELSNSKEPLAHKLQKPFEISDRQPEAITESVFRWEHNEDAMATEKLAEGIRLFAKDQQKLEGLLSSYL